MKLPNLTLIEESWDEKKDRVLNELSRKGHKFIEKNIKKMEEIKRNPPKIL